MAGWELLPIELQQEIWLWIPFPQIFRIRQVSTLWLAALSDNKFWKEFNRRHFGGPKVREKDKPKIKWMQQVKDQTLLFHTNKKTKTEPFLYTWIVKAGHNMLLNKLLQEMTKEDRDRLEKIEPPLLFVSALSGHLPVLTLLHEEYGFGLECKCKADGTTPLFGAAKAGHLPCVAYLLDKGVNIEAPRSSGSTPLFIASQGGFAEVVALLIKRGAKVHAPTHRGATPLSVSSQNGHAAVVKLLVDNGAPVSAPSTADGATPLSVSADRGHFEVVKFLIESGANINSLNVNGATPFYFACKGGHTNIVEIMIEKGANINLTTKKLATPLIAATQNGKSQIVKILLQHKADPNKINVEGVPALWYAVQLAHHKCVKILLKHDASPTVRKPSTGETALMLAIKKCDLRMVKILLARTPDPALINLTARNGSAPLHLACEGPSAIATPTSSSQPADSRQERQDTHKPEGKDREGEKGQEEEEGIEGIVRLLLNHGADYNLPNQQTGKLPLEIATEHNQSGIVGIIESFIAKELLGK